MLTDFGEADGFVGTMKGVILGISPKAQLVDLSHLIAPQNIRQAAFVLMTAAAYFPEGTVHLVVVDPGVGSARRPIAVETSHNSWVVPDNGVLSYALTQEANYRAVELASAKYRLPEVGNTFHGRDIFSPAAAHLAMGVALNELGPQVDNIVLLDPPRLKVDGSRIEAEVLKVDRFGNLRTSIHKLTWDGENALILLPTFGVDPESSPPLRFSGEDALIKIRLITIQGISTTFSDVEPGQVVAFVGSEGGLEIAVNQGNAAHRFGVETGDHLMLDMRNGSLGS